MDQSRVVSGLVSLFLVDSTVFVCSQDKEKQKVVRAKKVEQRLKKKAVQQHEHFKEAIKILQKHRMRAKKGRLLLKRHYVALIADAGGVKDPGTCTPPHTHTPTLSYTHIYTTPHTYSRTPLCITTS